MKTKTGINPFLPALFQKIASEHPDFVLHAGDCISGEYTSDDAPVQGDFLGMYTNFMNAAVPVYNYFSHSGVPLYTIRGNHDNGNRYEGNNSLKAAYQMTLARDLPDNGPEGESQLTYSFEHNGAVFIGLDEYRYHDGKPGVPDLAWLDETLNTKMSPLIFVWGHSPAFSVVKGIDPYPMYLFPVERDSFWQSLTDHHILMYFCGHSHLYCRGMINGTWQIIGGNGGGIPMGFYPENRDPAISLAYPKVPVPAEEQKTGYLLVTIDILNSTVAGVEKQYNPKSGVWAGVDIFSISFPVDHDNQSTFQE